MTRIRTWWKSVTRSVSFLAGAALLVFIGPCSLLQGISAQREHMWLVDHGVVGTGEVAESSSGYSRRADWAWVWLRTAGGDVESVYVSPVDGDTNRDVGASMQVRYDPTDPKMNEDVNGGSALLRRWFEIVSGTLFTGVLVILGIPIMRARPWRRTSGPAGRHAT